MTQKVHRIVRKIYCHLGSSEQRWPVLVALAGIGGLYTALPKALLPAQDLRFRWVPLIIVLVASIPLALSHRLRMHRINTSTAYVLLTILTLFMIASLWLLIYSLSRSAPFVPPARLLKSAASLWVTNVLVFACWYWRVDAGGPHARDRKRRHEHGAFLFPQMTMTTEQLEAMGQENWKPGFIDYVFLAFNSSTALSPADTPVLTRWAKSLMMIQAVISFTVIILLAARAVNILPQKDDPNSKPVATTPADTTTTGGGEEGAPTSMLDRYEPYAWRRLGDLPRKA